MKKKHFGPVILLLRRHIIRLGVDLGGTKIEVLIITEDGAELLRERVATPKINYQDIINAISALVFKSEKQVRQKCTIGICTPGSVSPSTSLMRNSNTTCLNDQPFKQDLENSLGREVRMANDANCFALSEAIDGVAKDACSVFGVIVGTGTGGGLVINKHVLHGANAIAGEWGHNPLPWPEEGELASTKCWCGQNGCIETFLSGPGLEKNYQKATQLMLKAEEIFALAEQGDIRAEEAISHYENRMARALAHVINIVDPNIIVLGGGISNVQRLYQNVPKLWDKWIFSEYVHTKLVQAKFGDASGVRGAAWLWNN
ncbi:MAG: ROK family protein [Pseudomonadota bacterium]